MVHLYEGTLLIFAAVACVTLDRFVLAAGIGGLGLFLLTR